MIYEYAQCNTFLTASIDFEKTLIRYNNAYYYNIAMSFDIETTSFYYDTDTDTALTNEQQKTMQLKHAEKRALMYIWQFAIDDNIVYGRTWLEFVDFCKRLQKKLKLYGDRYCIIYVHNFAYEFQFLSKMFRWFDVFADNERKPFTATNNFNMVFKCSYRLSGYSLETLAKVCKCNVEKKIGALDYSLIRNAKTVLSKDELEYCVNDVLIVTAYINQQIKEYENNICKIPLTQTGKVRRYLRKRCFEHKEYHYLMDKLKLDFDEYQLLKNAFAGGFTHANAMYTDNLCNDVTSFDFSSSYPAVLIAEKYPMSKGIKTEIHNEKELCNIIKNYACIIDVRFYNIKSVFLFENILGLSKCRNVKNVHLNNGRIISADCLTTSITDIDFLNLQKFYQWDKIEFGLCYIYKRDYLPRDIVSAILELYQSKTELKGVTGKEIEYQHAKELLNSIYGMCVTSITHDNFNFTNNQWNTQKNNTDSQVDIYNNDYNRFLFYPWGVWCTAYARNNLYTAILTCKDDYIYSDTDSVKIRHADKYNDYFLRYNNWITQKIKSCLNYHCLDNELATPKNKDGKIKPLGVWDFDGFYTDFKTLGAKRYMTKDKDNNYKITVCGLAKKDGEEYISQKKKPFEYFNCGMYVDDNHTGKMIHTYIDKEIQGYIVDYQGNKAYYNEKSYIHLEKTDFTLSMARMYIEYFKGVQKLY